MPNSVNLTTAINGKSVTVTDSTVYTNPTRANCGVFMAPFKVKYVFGEDAFYESVAFTPNTNDPELVSSFTFDITKDGHWVYKYISIPDYAGGSYNQHNAVFDPATDQVYVSKITGSNPLNNTTQWQLVTDPLTLVDLKGTASEPTNCDIAIVNKVFYPWTLEKRDLAAIDAALECCGDCKRNKDINRFQLLNVFAEALIRAEAYNRFSSANLIAGRAEVL